MQNDSSSEKPFDDTPFDAGVDTDEESDPKKFIEQLTGKLGQSLRKYNENQWQPDFELEKFAINSLLSATHTSEMDSEDQNDIINKIKKAGQNDNQESEPNNDDEGGVSDSENSEELNNNEDGDVSGLEENGNYFLKEVPKNNMFQPNSNDILKDKSLQESKKNSIFGRDYLKNKLLETFNQDDMANEPMTEPAPVVTPAPTKPSEPSKQPSRRDKPFLPVPNVQPRPKAIKESKSDFEIYHKTLSSCLDEINLFLQKRGFDTLEFNIGDIQHVNYGSTERFNKELTINNKPINKKVNVQIYRMDSGNYELNTYIG